MWVQLSPAKRRAENRVGNMDVFSSMILELWKNEIIQEDDLPHICTAEELDMVKMKWKISISKSGTALGKRSAKRAGLPDPMP